MTTRMIRARGRFGPDGMVVYHAQMLTTVSDGVWSFHERDQRPVEGTIVYRYRWGYSCEEHGRFLDSSTRPQCWHVKEVL